MTYTKLKKLNQKFPEFKGANWLIRIPLAIIFIQQGLDKLPFDPSTAETYELPLIVWFMVISSELLAGFGLLLGGIFHSLKILNLIGFPNKVFWNNYGLYSNWCNNLKRSRKFY